MDQAPLVDRQLDDGTKLVDQLRLDHFDLKAAFWLYSSEPDQWYLYIASGAVDEQGLTEAYKAALQSWRRLPDLRIDRFQMKLVAPDHPVASAVMDLLPQRRNNLPVRVGGPGLGGVYVEDAYVYPV